MSGTLQTLAFHPPAAASGGPRCPSQQFSSGGPRRPNRQSLSPPATHFDSSVQFLAGIAPPQFAVKPLLVPRLLAAGSDQVDGSGGVEAIDSNADVSEVLLWSRRVLDVVATNIIPFSLISGIILGLANPTPGCIAYKWSLPKFSTFGIFFISGLTLRSREIGAAVDAWPAGMFGLGSILLLTPLFSKLILQIQLDPREFITGIAIFCCMPTTLSTGVALTQIVGGNSALALAMTVMSNLLCIITVPFWLAKFVGAGTGVSVPTMYLLRSLVITLLVPLILGKVLRDGSKSVADYVDQNRRLFSVISAIFLGLVPWVQVSRSRSYFMTTKPAAFGIAISMGILVHLILLALNTVAVKSLAVVSGGSKSVFANKQNARAVVIVASQDPRTDMKVALVLGKETCITWTTCMSSLLLSLLLMFLHLHHLILSYGIDVWVIHRVRDSSYSLSLMFWVISLQVRVILVLVKTLPVMVAVVEQLKGTLGEPGLLVLPCIASHIIQIIIDSFLVNWWLRKDRLENETKAA